MTGRGANRSQGHLSAGMSKGGVSFKSVQSACFCQAGTLSKTKVPSHLSEFLVLHENGMKLPVTPFEWHFVLS